jgi:hypothetical protein
MKKDPLPKDVANMIWQDMRTKKLDINKYITDFKRDNSKIFDLRRRVRRGKTLDALIHMLSKDLNIEGGSVDKPTDMSTEKIEEIPSEKENRILFKLCSKKRGSLYDNTTKN